MPSRHSNPQVRLSLPDDRHVVVRIVAAALGFRVLSAIIALLVNLSFPLQQHEQFTVFESTSPFWDTFARYDSGWYYQSPPTVTPSYRAGRRRVSESPARSRSSRSIRCRCSTTGRLFGTARSDVYLGGILVSWMSFIAASVALFFLARLDLNRRQAERTVLLTAIFPFSFFFGMVYTEALFLLLTVLSFYGFRTRHWILGGLAGALATATRVNGILMLPVLAWIAYRTAQPTARDRLLAAAGLLLVAGGVGAYSLYVYHLSGNPFEWAMTIQRWDYHVGGAPWTAPLRLMRELVTHPYQYLVSNPMARYDTLYGLTAIGFLVLTPLVWLKLGGPYGLFMLMNLLLPLSSGVFEGIGRYLLGAISGVHLSGDDPLPGLRHRDHRLLRAVLHAGARALHEHSPDLLEPKSHRIN